MKWNHRLLTFLTNLNIGLCVPILSLMICEHGCTVQNLGICVAIFAATVVMAEIPSGVFADLFGRKLSFIFSHFAGAVSVGIILFSDDFWLTVVGMIFRGFSIALSSGSLDALIVEEAQSEYGAQGISKAVSQFQIFTSAGTSVGALLAGFIPYVYGYEVHLWISVFIYCVLIIISCLGLAENALRKKGESVHLKTHIKVMRQTLLDSELMKKMAICMISIAFVQASLETYWQPRLVEIHEGNIQYLLGILAATAYLATMAGCYLMGKIQVNSARKRWNSYILFAAGIMLSLVLLAILQKTLLFSMVYILIYLFIGFLVVAEQTIINTEIEDCVRASVLSVTSFLTRAGGLTSGVIGSTILMRGSISHIWLLFAGISFVILMVISGRKI